MSSWSGVFSGMSLLLTSLLQFEHTMLNWDTFPLNSFWLQNGQK